ncbi:GTP cyclohydrolase I [Prosthecobacter debontii]|uniref:GTP cyclohydrolase FolE2 n=1 Tax=Prosthecobacter debontii TaxID=48467 RepID=A0A1T4X8B9_9BACT|nr:GTP cyclohydrolase FolE2 [Prosthecobacter debontii]SKA85833.1 GTP cyclohydrolase I [Prosthecobacter debontii]
MPSSLKDTQNERDDRKIAIDRVGVKNLRFPLRIRDRDQSQQHTVATVTMAVDLPHHYKGTHMSRFVEVLHAHGRELTVASIAAMPRELLSRLNARKAHVEMRFPYFRAKRAPVTKAEGLLDYGVVFEVNAEGDEVDYVVTVEVPVATLCPCSKAISERGAHNQRGLVTLSVRFRQPIWIEDLIELVEASASSQLYSVLKRPDEKYVTEAAYDNPVFVEDLVRSVAQKAYGHKQIKWFRVEAENFESIHNHNAWAVIESHNQPALI